MCDLAEIKAELAREEAIFAKIEASVEDHAIQLSYLHGEYELNKSRVLHYYKPALRPLREITYAIANLESLINLQIQWHEAKLGKIDASQTSNGNEEGNVKSCSGGYVHLAHKMLENAKHALQESYEAMKDCPEDTLKMISNYSSPPDEAIATMELVMLLRDEEECSWKAAQVIVSYTYFTNFFEPRSESMLKKYDLLPEHKMQAIEEFCRHPEHSVKALYSSSTPIGCLGQWIHAVRDFYRVKYITAPLLLQDKSADNMNRAKKLLDELTFHQEFDKLIKKVKLQMKVSNEDNKEHDDVDNQKSKDLEEEGDDKTKAKECTEMEKEGNKNEIIGNDTSVASEQTCSENTSETMTQMERLKALEAEEAAVKKAYKELKERLLYKASGANNDYDMVLLLKHRLNECRQHYNQAMESMSVVQSKINDALSRVRDEYDGTMIPIECELEDDTEQLIKNFSSANELEVAETNKNDCDSNTVP